MSDGGASGDRQWQAGDAPSQALAWCVRAFAKAGTLSIIGVYPPKAETFPIGLAMNKNLTIHMGNCNHRKYIPELVEIVRSGQVDPLEVMSHQAPMSDVINAYKACDRREPGWIKVELFPTGPEPSTAAEGPEAASRRLVV